MMRIATAVSIIVSFGLAMPASDVSRARMSSEQRSQAQTTLSTPSMGFLIRRQNPVEIRPVWGVPGSTFVADAIALPHVHFATIGANHRWAILAGDGGTSVVTLAGGAAGVSQKLEVAATPDLVVSSPGGSAAALYSSKARTIWVITGFDSKPRTLTIYSGPELPEKVKSLAVSDVVAGRSRVISDRAGRWSPPSEDPEDGESATLAVAVGTNDGVALLHHGGVPEQLYSSAAVTSLSFVGRTTDIAAIDRARTEVVEISTVSRARSVIASAPDGVVKPSAIVTSSVGIAFLDGDNVFFTTHPGHALVSVKGMAGASELMPTSIPGIVLVRGAGAGARLINFNEVDPHPYLVSVPPDRSRQ